MLSTDQDGLHGTFLTVDENGQRLFALTTSGVTVLQLSNVPLGIGTIAPAAGPVTGGTSLTIRGSGFQSGAKATLWGKRRGNCFQGPKHAGVNHAGAHFRRAAVGPKQSGRRKGVTRRGIRRAIIFSNHLSAFLIQELVLARAASRIESN